MLVPAGVRSPVAAGVAGDMCNGQEYCRRERAFRASLHDDARPADAEGRRGAQVEAAARGSEGAESETARAGGRAGAGAAAAAVAGGAGRDREDGEAHAPAPLGTQLTVPD